jgi:hypothetical protein
MKRIIISLLLVFSIITCFGQKGAITYEDIKFLLHNNLMQVDTFLTVKGYAIAKRDNNTKNREYNITAADGTRTDLKLRLDGKRMYIELETNQPNQYALIHDSIQQFLDKNAAGPDVQTFVVRNLGTIYVTEEDAPDGNPIHKDFDIHIIGDKHITTYDE